jgi:ABC-type dipeptide/oligopeptide/nickel transport system permease component
MVGFIFKRMCVSIPILFFLSFLTLVLINSVPGNYFDQMRLNPNMSDEIII